MGQRGPAQRDLVPSVLCTARACSARTARQAGHPQKPGRSSRICGNGHVAEGSGRLEVGCGRVGGVDDRMWHDEGQGVGEEVPLGLHGLADLARGPLRFINRQPGSGTRLLTDHLLARQGLPASTTLAGQEAVEDSHLAVAAAIASGLGDAGVGIAAAAEQFGLDLVPLVEEDYFLVCLKDALEQPAVRQLCQALAGAPMRAAVDGLGGYALHEAGEVLSLTRALPWWHFRSPKEARAVHPAPAG